MTTLADLLAKIEELDQKATKGPWRTKRKLVGHCINDEYGDGNYPLYSTFLCRGPREDQIHSGESRFDRVGSGPDVPHEADAQLMALSRTALPAMAKAMKLAIDALWKHAQRYEVGSHQAQQTLTEIESLLSEVGKEQGR